MRRRAFVSSVPLIASGCSSIGSTESSTPTETERSSSVQCPSGNSVWNSFFGDRSNSGGTDRVESIDDPTVEMIGSYESRVQNVVFGNEVGIVSTEDGLRGIDRDSGDSVWLTDEKQRGVPATTCSSVCYPTPSKIVARDVKTGDKLWSRDGGFGLSNPLYVPHETSFIVLEQSVAVASIDARSGTERWRQVYSDLMFSGIAATDRTVFATVGATTESDQQGLVIAFDAESGDELWRNDDLTSIFCSPSVHDGTVYVIEDQSTLLAIDGSNGSVDWRHSLPATDASTTPVVPSATSVVCVPSYETESLIAVDRSTGERRWSRELGTGIMYPLCTASSILVASSRGLHSLSQTNGSIRWHRSSIDVRSLMAISRKGLYFGFQTELNRVTTAEE